MCGFAGVIAWDERYRVSHETLAKMSAAIAHRGPDGEGFHFNHHDPITPDQPQVSLAFRRLAILDPDPRSMQPFTDGRHWLVFNGEIYNFRELKKELSLLRPDYLWKTTGDTEVLLCAYAVWGEKCVEHLNGMFAFAVWDEVEKSLFLARDRMGQKPLYVAWIDKTGQRSDDLNYHFPIREPQVVIAFGSELSALAPLTWMDRSVDPWNLALYLSVGYFAEGTIYKGARQLEPSRWLRASHNGMGVAPYYDNDTNIPQDFPANITRQLVLRAVQRQLVSDVPLGCLLSGGIDSSVIVAATKAASGDVQTFSIGFDDARYDETQYAVEVSKRLGTKHHSFKVTPDAASDLPKLAATFGEPLGDSSVLPTHYLARETRGYVKVALSGDGGDELFGGYDRYRAMQLSERLHRLPLFLRKKISRLAGVLPGTHPKSNAHRIKRFVDGLNLPADERYATYVRLFQKPLLNQLMRRPPEEEADALVGKFGAMYHKLDGVSCAVRLDCVTYLPHDLLTKVDRCSMLHGLEVRSPFMDHELVQFAAGLTADQLLKGGPKRMLREAFADDLPAWVFKRKKMGFAVPIGDWFRGQLRAMLRDTLFSTHAFGRTHFDMKVVERLVDEHETKRVDHSQRLYALLMLELWWNTVRG